MSFFASNENRKNDHSYHYSGKSNGKRLILVGFVFLMSLVAGIELSKNNLPVNTNVSAQNTTVVPTCVPNSVPTQSVTTSPVVTTAPISGGICDIDFMIASDHYSASYGNIFYYYWMTEGVMGGTPTAAQRDARLAALLTDMTVIPNSSKKMLMISSYATAEHVLQRSAAELKSKGVQWIGYNTEGPPVSTPTNELNAMHLASESNSVARMAKLVDSYGFNLMWGPIRNQLEAVPDAALQAMKAGGLDGIGVQEQQGIESGCVSCRKDAVQATTDRYRSIFGNNFQVYVQLMSTRCPSYSVCKQFSDQVLSAGTMGTGGPVNGIAIWANPTGTDATNLPGFMQALCQGR